MPATFTLRELHNVTQLLRNTSEKICRTNDALQNLGGSRGSFLASRHSVCLWEEERTMFKFVGWVVVTSFALFGLAKFVEEHVVIDVHEKARATG